jgi:HEAT repeat protein
MSATADFFEAELTAEQIEPLLADLDRAELFAKHLWDGRVFMRRNASTAVRLAADAPIEATSLLAVAAKDADPDVRGNAVAALGLCPDLDLGTATAAILTALTDRVEAVRATAVEALDRLADKRSDELIPLLVDALGDDRSPVRAAAASVLVRLGAASVGALIPKLAHDNAELRKEAFRTLARVGTDAAEALVAALPGEAVRPHVVALLVALPALDADLREAVATLRDDPASSASLRAATVKVLSLVGTSGAKAAPKALEADIDGFLEGRLEDGALDKASLELAVLELALRDPRWHVRANACDVVAAMASSDPGFAELGAYALAPSVRDPESAVRAAALRALGATGHPAAIAPALVGVRDPNGAASAAGRDAIAAIAGEHAQRVLEALGADTPFEVRAAVIAALAATDAAQAGVRETLAGSDRALAREAAAAISGRRPRGEKAAVASLVAALGDESAEVRRAATDALGHVAAADDSTVLAALAARSTDAEPAIRRAASLAALRVRGLPLPGEDGPAPEPIDVDGFETELLDGKALGDAAKAGAPRLLMALRDGRAVVRANAVAALGALESSEESVLAALLAATRDGDATVRARALAALGATKPAAWPAAVPALARALRDPVPSVREAAGAALDGMGKKAAEPLVAALDIEPDAAALTVIPRLVALGKDAIAPLADALNHVSVRVRANAVAALGLLGPDHEKKTREPVELALGDGADLVRACARLALDRIDGVAPAPRNLEPLDLPDGFDGDAIDPKEAKKAAKALGDAGLARALGDGRAAVRANAARAVASLGDGALPFAESLAAGARDADPGVRAAMVAALGAVPEDGWATSVRALASALDDRSGAVAQAAREALQALGADAAPAMVACFDRDPATVERSLAPLVGSLGAKALPALEAALDHVAVPVRASAATTLGFVDSAAARELLGRAQSDENESVRTHAKRALDRLDGVVPPPRFLEAVELPDGFETDTYDDKAAKKAVKGVDADELARRLFDGRPTVRANAARTLGAAGKDAEAHLSTLLIALKDGNPEVRVAVAGAVGSLGLDPEASVTALVAAFSRNSDGLEDAVVEAVGSFAKKAVDPVLSLVGGHPTWVMQTVGRVVRRLPDTFLAGLEGLAKGDGEPHAQPTAIDLICSLGQDAQKAEKTLLGLLDHRDPQVRGRAGRALGACAKPSAKVKEALSDLLARETNPAALGLLEEGLRTLSSNQRQT